MYYYPLYNSKRPREIAKMFTTLTNYSGEELQIDKGSINHTLSHIACFIVVIDNVIKISSSRKFSKELMYNIIWEFNFNLQFEIWLEVEKIDPHFSKKLNVYEKKLSIISSNRKIYHDELYNLLLSIRNDIYNFCKYFKDYNNIDNEIKNNEDYYEYSGKDLNYL